MSLHESWGGGGAGILFTLCSEGPASGREVEAGTLFVARTEKKESGWLRINDSGLCCG